MDERVERRTRQRAVTGAPKGGTSNLHESAGADEITSLYCMYIYVNQSILQATKPPTSLSHTMNHTMMQCRRLWIKTVFRHSIVSSERYRLSQSAAIFKDSTTALLAQSKSD